jgi:hypothetical protein
MTLEFFLLCILLLPNIESIKWSDENCITNCRKSQFGITKNSSFCLTKSHNVTSSLLVQKCEFNSSIANEVHFPSLTNRWCHSRCGKYNSKYPHISMCAITGLSSFKWHKCNPKDPRIIYKTLYSIRRPLTTTRRPLTTTRRPLTTTRRPLTTTRRPLTTTRRPLTTTRRRRRKKPILPTPLTHQVTRRPGQVTRRPGQVTRRPGQVTYKTPVDDDDTDDDGSGFFFE